MPRIRTIKPEFWTSEQIVECSRDARLLFIGLWNFADDFGRHKASVIRLKMEVLPGDALSTCEVREWVRELIAAELLEEYEVDGNMYWQITGWAHQKIDQPNAKHPAPCGAIPLPRRRLGGKQRQLAHAKLIKRDGEKCCNCGAKSNLAVDHVIPFSKGGSNDLDNLRLLCGRCNAEKSNKVRDRYATGTRQVREGFSPPETETETETETESNKGASAPFNPRFLDLPIGTSEFKESWLAFCRHRSEKRQRLTKTNCERLLKKLASWGEVRAIAAIDHTIAMGWTGIREPETPVRANGKKSMDELLEGFGDDE